MQASPGMSLCPSFSAHSDATLADIASRVVDEFTNESHPDWIELEPHPQHPLLQSDHPLVRNIEEEGRNGSDEEFEFAFVTAEPNCSPISADQIFHNGRIKPVYPVGSDFSPRPKTTPSGRVSLRRLMMEDREAPAKQPGGGGGGRNCKRWRLRDLVHRSNGGDGEGNFVFVSHSGDDKTTREGEARRSFHAQKQDLMGILANVNGLNRKLRPF